MGSLNRVVDQQISMSSRAPSRASFGTPLIAAYHTNWPQRVREYSDADELLDDGFTTGDVVYKKASVMMQQRPKPSSFKVGRRANVFTQTFHLTPINVTEDFVYEFTLLKPDGTTSVITYTVPDAASVGSVADAIGALVTTALTGIATVDMPGTPSTHIEVTVDTVPGEMVGVQLHPLDPIDDMAYQDVTADPGLAADLAAIKAFDNKWYCLLLDSNSEAEVKAAMAWVEAEDNKVGHFQTSDSEVVDVGVSDDLASDVMALGYFQSILWFDPHTNTSGLAAGIASQLLAKDPGTYTAAFKTVTGVAGTDLKESYRNVIEAKNANWYGETGGVNVTFEGKTPSGEWIDTQRFIDLLFARIQEADYANKLNNDKVPYDDNGVAATAGLVRGVLNRHTSTEKIVLGLAADPAPEVTADPVANADVADKIARTYKTVRFSGTLSGAIHKTTIRGNISP